jgi:hypothetical protein
MGLGEEKDRECSLSVVPLTPLDYDKDPHPREPGNDKILSPSAPGPRQHLRTDTPDSGRDDNGAYSSFS